MDGLTTGVVEIVKDTAATSLIHLLGGLDTGGEVLINTDEADLNANGDIQVGPVTYLCCPPPPITFNGCIHIYDEAGTGNGGALIGEIVVAGCHDPGDLNICIDGHGGENVTLAQTDCPNQVDWLCLTCP